MDYLDELRKELGADKIYLASEAPEMEVVSSGSISLDFATGVGGIPQGTQVEFFGRESVGKTSLSYYAIAEQQKLGRPCAFLNLEGRFNAEWARSIAGVDLTNLLVVAPDPGTEAVTALAKIVEKGIMGLVVFDSIGAMLGDKEQGAAEGNAKQAGGQSALVTHMVKAVSVPAYRNKTTVLYLNQVRDIFGAMISGLEESPGGHALKHMATMRAHLKPAGGSGTKIYGVHNGEKIEVGYRVNGTLKKNKVGAPKTTFGFNFYNVETDGKLGLDKEQETLDLAFQYGIIERSGKNYFHRAFPDGQLAVKDTVVAYLQENPEAMEEVRKDLMDKSRGQ